MKTTTKTSMEKSYQSNHLTTKGKTGLGCHHDLVHFQRQKGQKGRVATTRAIFWFFLCLLLLNGFTVVTVDESQGAAGIQNAINNAAGGDYTIKLRPGVFPILHSSSYGIEIRKSLMLKGNQAGNDARHRSGTNETVIKGGANNIFILYITAGNVTIDGITITSDYSNSGG